MATARSAIVSGGVSIEPKGVRSKLRLDRELKNRVSLERSPGEEQSAESQLGFEVPFWK